MVKIIDVDLFESKANLLVHQVNCHNMSNGVALKISETFPHVEVEYRKYIRHCKKSKVELLGTVQYVPADDWALIMVDTMKNEKLEAYDKNYQYIVNMFSEKDFDMENQQTDLKAMKKAMRDICKKAKSIGSTVAIPFGIGSSKGGTRWNDVYSLIKEVFDNSGVDVEICKY